ncbi:MAG: heavy metal-binding domain-containing protein [Actinobacteria bacterium]|nr:heavy metal-binding domain-containing protein [Actinomycetota bacterium]MCL6104861.1 heavy metal-binding domain-containing protein [Actinomycetota bacterium]
MMNSPKKPEDITGAGPVGAGSTGNEIDDVGDLPEAARSRIRETEEHGGAWSSDLSVDEALAISTAGYKPLGLVMGSSIYHIGFGGTGAFSTGGGLLSAGGAFGPGYSGALGTSSRRIGTNGYYQMYPCPHGYTMVAGDHYAGVNWENTIFEEGMTKARNLAIGRLVEEAKGLGAHGVVGVELTLRPFADTNSVLEFTAFGTAIYSLGAPAVSTPFTSNLSGQSFEKLLLTGYMPVALVMGVAAIEADAGCATDYRLGSWVNNEVSQYTDAVQLCREMAVERLESEAAQFGDGVVGTWVDFNLHEIGERSKLIEMTVLGTAVKRFSDTRLASPPLPIMRLVDK